MKKLQVHYSGWGRDFQLGTLAEFGRDTLFEFSKDAIAQGLDLSPIQFPLATTGTVIRPTHGGRPTPGFIDDALPDGWGLLLMDRALAAKGLSLTQVTSLDRLAIVGDTAFGALRFEPAAAVELEAQDVAITDLARAVSAVLDGKPSELLPTLLRAGSPQGARPKAAVWYEPSSHRMSTGPFGTAEPWLVKFPAKAEDPEVCDIEKVYALLAHQCGIEMPPTLSFPLENEHSAAFAVKRFDRINGHRVPVQSLAAVLDVDFARTSLDYGDMLLLVKRLTRDQREVEKLFTRCVFNVVFNNRDDHLKNFAVQLSADGHWHLTPAYDLTFSEGPQGQHWSLISGVGRDIRRDHLLALAARADIKKLAAISLIERVLNTVPALPRLASKYRIRKETTSYIAERLRSNAANCNVVPMQPIKMHAAADTVEKLSSIEPTLDESGPEQDPS